MEHTFTTADGREIKIRPVSLFVIDRLRAGFVFPPKPTYTATTAGGDVEVHDHDEKTLVTDEDKAAWAAWKAEMARLSADYAEKANRTWVMLGTDIDVPDGDWIKLHEFCGLTVPADPLERRWYYITTVLFSDDKELARLITEIARISNPGPTAEEVEAAKASFRRKVERETAGGPADQKGQVVKQPKAVRRPRRT